MGCRVKLNFAWVETLIGASVVVLVGMALGFYGVELEGRRVQQRQGQKWCGCLHREQCAEDNPAQCTGCCPGRQCIPGPPSPTTRDECGEH